MTYVSETTADNKTTASWPQDGPSTVQQKADRDVTEDERGDTPTKHEIQQRTNPEPVLVLPHIDHNNLYATVRAGFGPTVPDVEIATLMADHTEHMHQHQDYDGTLYKPPDFGPNPYPDNSQAVPELRVPVTTPFNVAGFKKALLHHPNRAFADYVIEVLTAGADLGVRNIEQHGHKGTLFANAASALTNKTVVDAWLAKRIMEGSVVTIQDKRDIPHLYFNKLAVKVGDKPRVVCNLSHPYGESLNSCIDSTQTSLTYPRIAALVQVMQRWPETNAALSKDVRSAFHNVPVTIGQRHLLAFHWRGHVYCMLRLALGIRSASKIYCAVGLAINYHITTSLCKAGLTSSFIVTPLLAANSPVTDNYGCAPIVYCDDHHVAFANAEVAQEAYPVVDKAFQELTVPNAIEKDARGNQLTFIGFQIDYRAKTLAITDAKRDKIVLKLRELQSTRRLHAVQGRSILGVLIYMAQLTRGITPFLTGLNGLVYATLRQAKLTGQHTVTIPSNVLADIEMLVQHLSRFPLVSVVPERVARMVTDASGKSGNGAGGFLIDHNGAIHWLAYKHPPILCVQNEKGEPTPGTESSSALLEVLVVATMILEHRHLLSNTLVLATLDAQAAIGALKGFKSYRTAAINHVLKLLSFPMGESGITLHTYWQPRETILIQLADHLSRLQTSEFLELCPGAKTTPTKGLDQLPQTVAQVVSFLERPPA